MEISTRPMKQTFVTNHKCSIRRPLVPIKKGSGLREAAEWALALKEYHTSTINDRILPKIISVTMTFIVLAKIPEAVLGPIFKSQNYQYRQTILKNRSKAL
jgi:hypothetical protein